MTEVTTKPKTRLSNKTKGDVIAEFVKRMGKDATEDEICRVFYDTIQKEVVPKEKQTGFASWQYVRKWLVNGFRQELLRKEGETAEALRAEIEAQKQTAQNPEMEKKVGLLEKQIIAVSNRQDVIDKQCNQIFNNHAEVIAKLETQIMHHNTAMGHLNEGQRDGMEMLAALAKGIHDLARATREVFVTLDYHKELLTPSIAKEILRIEEEVSPVINAVLAIPTTIYKIAVVGLIPTQQSIIKEEYGSRLKITFISADELKGSKCADRMKGADAIFVMTGFISHAAVMKQFKDKTRNCNGGMTGLKKEINLFLKMVVEKAQ